MGGLGVTDYLFLYSIICIWLILFVNIILSIFGYVYYLKVIKMDVDKSLEEYPMVSILVPAHNEEKVIEKTVRALLSLNYPKNCMEVYSTKCRSNCFYNITKLINIFFIYFNIKRINCSKFFE